MKKILLLPIALLSTACCSQKPLAMKKAEITSVDCPPDGDCTIAIIANKSIDIKKDDIGALYYDLVDSPGTSVVHFQYKRRVDPTLADANYREEVVFEINNEKPELNLSGAGLQYAKALYGRFCFCRGQTGNYKIHDGNLKVEKERKGLRVNMNYNITEVPQLIKEFDLIIK